MALNGRICTERRFATCAEQPMANDKDNMSAQAFAQHVSCPTGPMLESPAKESSRWSDGMTTAATSRQTLQVYSRPNAGRRSENLGVTAVGRHVKVGQGLDSWGRAPQDPNTPLGCSSIGTELHPNAYNTTQHNSADRESKRKSIRGKGPKSATSTRARL